MSWDDVLETICEEAPGLLLLALHRVSTATNRPRRHDFLANFPQLRNLEVSGAALASDALQYLGPAIHRITLIGEVLTAPELASCLVFRNFQQYVLVELKNSGYNERSRTTLTVRACILISSSLLNLFVDNLLAKPVHRATILPLICSTLLDIPAFADP